MTQNKRLDFNAAAPDLTVLDTAGQPVQLSSLWAARPLLLAFTRHFGCTQCKVMLDELTATRERLEEAGLALAVITQGTPEMTAEFARTYAPGLLLLADPERKAYQAYGLERGTVFQTVLNRRVWQAVAQAKQKGYHLESPPAGQDAMQMSGAFIIGQDGRIQLPYYYDDIADHPSLELLLNGVLATPWGAAFEGPIGPSAAKLDHESGRAQ